MKKIASFTINHDTLQKGLYVSRVDGDVVTYDLRLKRPNADDFFSTGAGHTLEHLFATHARNGKYADQIVYVGPMGCRTGFYLLVRDAVSKTEVIKIVTDAMAFAKDFVGEIPGSKKEECGNYLDHDLSGAKALAKEAYDVLKNWSEDKMEYQK